MAAAKSDHPPLLSLEEIEVSIVSDSKISKVHADFLGDDSPTDVITFHHGEILISADTALRQGLDHRQSMDQELALYLVHGLLHLAGWEDEDPEEQTAMHRLQEKILASAIASL
jgi:probable rRNA maturation factor